MFLVNKVESRAGLNCRSSASDAYFKSCFLLKKIYKEDTFLCQETKESLFLPNGATVIHLALSKKK